ncbi:hypothetical protein U1Q18_049505 [Sarracenia purpurea var. burkii]
MGHHFLLEQCSSRAARPVRCLQTGHHLSLGLRSEPCCSPRTMLTNGASSFARTPVRAVLLAPYDAYKRGTIFHSDSGPSRAACPVRCLQTGHHLSLGLRSEPCCSPRTMLTNGAPSFARTPVRGVQLAPYEAYKRGTVFRSDSGPSRAARPVRCLQTGHRLSLGLRSEPGSSPRTNLKNGAPSFARTQVRAVMIAPCDAYKRGTVFRSDSGPSRAARPVRCLQTGHHLSLGLRSEPCCSPRTMLTTGARSFARTRVRAVLLAPYDAYKRGTVVRAVLLAPYDAYKRGTVFRSDSGPSRAARPVRCLQTGHRRPSRAARPVRCLQTGHRLSLGLRSEPCCSPVRCLQTGHRLSLGLRSEPCCSPRTMLTNGAPSFARTPVRAVLLAPYDAYKRGTVFRSDSGPSRAARPVRCLQTGHRLSLGLRSEPCCSPRTMLTNGGTVFRSDSGPSRAARPVRCLQTGHRLSLGLGSEPCCSPRTMLTNGAPSFARTSVRAVLLAPYDAYKRGTVFRSDSGPSRAARPVRCLQTGHRLSLGLRSEPCCSPRTMLTNGAPSFARTPVRAVLLARTMLTNGAPSFARTPVRAVLLAPYDAYKRGTVFRSDSGPSRAARPVRCLQTGHHLSLGLRSEPCCSPRTMLTNGALLSLHDVQA